MSGSDRGRGGRGRGRGDFEVSFSNRGRGDYHSSDRGDRGRGRGWRSDRGGRGRGGPAEVEVFSVDGGSPPVPNSNVTKIENEIQKAALKLSAKKGGLDPRMPLRPGFGTQGKEVSLWANHMQIAFDSNLLLFRYNIEIRPEAGKRDPKSKMVKRIVQQLLEEHFPEHKPKIATDFKSNLISNVKLEIQGEYVVRYRTEYEEEAPPNTPIFRIHLQHTGSLTVSELMDHLTSTALGDLFDSKDEVIQALNIVMGHHPKADTQLASIGANKHFDLAKSTSERFDLGAGLWALRGFFVSVRTATSRILLNVQVKHAAFYEEGPLEGLMIAFMSKNGPSKVKLGNFLKKLSINVTHIVRKNKSGRAIPRIKTITGLATPDDGYGQTHKPKVLDGYGSGPKKVEFFLAKGPSDSTQGKSKKKGKKDPKPAPEPAPSEGKYISVYEHFKAYNIAIANTNLPVVNVGTREKPSYLPPQVCMVLPGQAANMKLSPSQTQQMIRFAVRKPAQNAQSIVTSGVQTLGLDPANPTLNAFGIGVRPELIVVPGRVLNPPAVKYGGNNVEIPRFGSWNMRSAQFATKSQLPYWTYLWISSGDSHDPWGNDMELKSSLDEFTAMLRQVGIEAAGVTKGMHISVTPNKVEGEIDSAISKFARSANPPKFLLVILPSVDTTIYNRVKFACDITYGFLNVCVVANKFAKPNNHQYFANVALKVNLKLGARNQFLDTSKLGILSEGKTMVVGIDVTHPSPGSALNAPSVAGVVASVDRWLAQWPADLQAQTAREEMVLSLSSMIKSRLNLWMKFNGSYPQNILVYRDGVSEGQYDLVLENELPAIRQACKEVYSAQSTKQGIPHICIVVVGKRHNTRFYPTNSANADRSSNPQNGTVVDRGVTEARNWDFFLQAHTALQGTARPAHYYIIYDDIFRNRDVQKPFQNTADVLEDLTHNLCYLFGRATKAVSICPPAYYADLVCERARCYLSGLFDPSPQASAAPSVVGEGSTAPSVAGVDSSLVRIHENVRDSMFYI